MAGSAGHVDSSCRESLQHMDPSAASATSAGHFTGCAHHGKATASGNVWENFSCKILLIIILWFSPPPDKTCVTNSQMVYFILCWRRPSLPGACPFPDILTFGFFPHLIRIKNTTMMCNKIKRGDSPGCRRWE